MITGRELVVWLQRALGISGICFYEAGTGEVYSTGSITSELESDTRATYIAGQDQADPAAGITIRRLITAGRATGAIAFQGLQNPEFTAEPLVLLAAAVLERERQSLHATEIAVNAGIDAFRSAVFEALANECKKALTTILAATGGVRQAGFLRPEQLEMTDLVEEEASRLEKTISRLDCIARLYHGDVVPRTEPANLTLIVEQAIDQWTRTSPDPVVFAPGDAVFKVLADLELIRFAVTQLLDNASQASGSGAAVHVEVKAAVESESRSVAVRIFGEGIATPCHLPHRIFDRACIADPASNAPRLGLGLYAARKIVVAHGGTLDLDEEKMQTQGVAFRLSLPLASGASDD